MIKILKTIFSGFYYAVDFLAYCAVKDMIDRENAERREIEESLNSYNEDDEWE